MPCISHHAGHTIDCYRAIADAEVRCTSARDMLDACDPFAPQWGALLTLWRNAAAHLQSVTDAHGGAPAHSTRYREVRAETLAARR